LRQGFGQLHFGLEHESRGSKFAIARCDLLKQND
jgi:hypothetical protein